MFRRDLFKNAVGLTLASKVQAPRFEPARLMRVLGTANPPYLQVFTKVLPQLINFNQDKPLINEFGVSIYLDPCGISTNAKL